MQEFLESTLKGFSNSFRLSLSDLIFNKAKSYSGVLIVLPEEI